MSVRDNINNTFLTGCRKFIKTIIFLNIELRNTADSIVDGCLNSARGDIVSGILRNSCIKRFIFNASQSNIRFCNRNIRRQRVTVNGSRFVYFSGKSSIVSGFKCGKFRPRKSGVCCCFRCIGSRLRSSSGCLCAVNSIFCGVVS